jgi:hypothetical protein
MITPTQCIAIAIISGALLIRPALAACPDGWDCVNPDNWRYIGRMSTTLVPSYTPPVLQDFGSPTWSPATKEDIDNLNKRLDAIEKLIRSIKEERR